MELRPGYKQTEVGVIPEDWEVREIADFSRIITGPFGTLLKASEYTDGDGVPQISVGEIGDGCFRVGEHTSRIPMHVVKRLPQYLLRSGDVVFGRKGAVERSALVTEEQNGWFLGSDGISVRPTGGCHPPYLAAQLRSGAVKTWLLSNAVGTTMPSLNQRVLGRVSVPFAPAAEQSAIATALGDVDALLAAQEALIAKKRAIKQGAMQELLTGKRRLPGFSGDWEVKRLDELAEIDPESLGANTPNNYVFNYISLEDVDSGTLRGHSEQLFFTAPSRARRKLRTRDVLVSTVRPNLKSHLLFAEKGKDWICSTGFSVVRCLDGVSHPAFVFAQLFTATVSFQIDALLTGSSYPAINSRDVRKLAISVPGYEEQTAVAAALSDMDSELAALEAQRAKTAQLKQGMMQALLTGRIRLI